MTRKSQKILAGLVDELGMIKAQAAALATREEQIKRVLLDAGRPVIEGTAFRATCAQFERETLDRDKVAGLLAPAVFQTCLKTSTVTQVRVSARSVAQAVAEARRVA